MNGVKNKKFSIKDITILAACTSIIFVQEQALFFLPNIQLTVLLLVVYSKRLGLIKTSIIIFIHTLLDCIVTGSLNLYYFPFMLLGWLLIPIIITIFFKKCENPLILAAMGVVFSLLYSWCFIIPNLLIPNGNITGTSFVSYLVADLPFESLIAASSFISILWLYIPCIKIFDKVLKEAKA